MISIKTKEEIDILREGGRKLARVLHRVAAEIAPGKTTLELDLLSERLILECGGTPAFKGYQVQVLDPGGRHVVYEGTSYPYPATMCISVNDEVVHAIPCKDKILQEGDVVSLDIGMWYRKLCTDMAVTVGVGKVSSEAARLIAATKESLDLGIAAVHAGGHIGDIGHAVEQRLKKDHLGIIRDLAGHGVGYGLHEDPFIPNFGSPGTGPELKEGMVICIEPMATLGTWRVVLGPDEWTYKTADHSLAAHFEHTLAVAKDGAEVLTRTPLLS